MSELTPPKVRMLLKRAANPDSWIGNAEDTESDQVDVYAPAPALGPNIMSHIGAVHFRDNGDMRLVLIAPALAHAYLQQADEIERLRDALERERTQVAAGVSALDKVLDGYDWLCEGRGPYAYDDDRYKDEFGHALTAMRDALPPLRRIAKDWTDCPRDWREIQAARAALASEDQP